ncbi:MAG: hypothetical protein H0Z39_00435 [Peptococcaceae bacterium]|nr:hypothetical protein [Peptococcaceae bacterium]
MNFIDRLPVKWGVPEAFDATRINLMREGVLTLVGIKRLESEALFVSSEGIGTLRETAKVEFAGKERYWWLARKYNGVLRRVLLAKLNVNNCTVDKPCVACEVCGLLGGLSTDNNKSLFSRLKVQDLISVQPYEYDEKFRVRLPDEPNANPTPFQEVIVPPGTEFPFIVRLIKPSQRDLMLFLHGNQLADGLGYGNYSKLRGNATTDWLLMANGFAHLSVYRLLSSEKSLAKQIEEFAQAAVGVTAEDVLTGDDLFEAINQLSTKFQSVDAQKETVQEE